MSKCSYNYNNKVYDDKGVEALSSYHMDVYDAVERYNSKLASKPLKKFKDHEYKLDKFRLPKDTAQMSDVNKLLNDINRTYGNVLTKTKVRSNSGSIVPVLKIDVSPYDSEIIGRYLFEESMGKEANEYLQEGEVRPSQYYRALNDSKTIEDIGYFNERASYMEQKFNEAGIPVKVFFDSEQEETGKLLGENDPLRDKLKLQDGEHGIVVNPTKLYKDTAFHEFGHLFIEMIGGVQNYRIQEAFKELEGTALYQDVLDRYPELSGDALIKEVVTTALGKEAEQIYNEKEKQNWWKRFVLWFKNTVSKVLPVPTSKVTELASSFINEQFQADNVVVGETMFQKEKEFKTITVLKRRLNTLEGIREQARITIQKQLSSIGNVTNLNDIKKQYKEELKIIEKKLADLDNTEDETAVIGYLEFIQTRIQNIEKQLNSQDNFLSLSSNYKAVITILKSYKRIVDSFGLVDDISASIDDGLLRNSKNISDENKDKIRQLAEALTSKYKSLEKRIPSIAVNPMANLMASYSNKEIVKRKEQLEIEYNNLDQKPEESREDWVDARIQEELPEIREREVANMKQALRRSEADITDIGRLFSSEKDLNNIIIQIASKMLDDSDLKKDFDVQNKLQDAQKALKTLKGSGVDPKNRYKGYYEEGSDGNLYITTQYSVEFYIEHKKLQEKIANAALDYGAGSDEHKAAIKEFKFWKEKNISKGTPIKKWLNPNYDQVKDNEAYKFIVDTSIEINTENLGGTQSNLKNVNAANAQFIKAPMLVKRGFEQISSGSMVKNAWESLESLWKVKSDDTEFGQYNPHTKERAKQLRAEIKRRQEAGESIEDLVEEVNTLSILTNEISEEKKQVPIYYRGQHNLDEQSYDLMSLIMMDYHMSVNFREKNRIKNTLELLADIMDNSSVAKTQGIAKKVMVTALGKNTYSEVKAIMGEDSNISKVLRSVIENRLYGIKTINQDYGKVAQSLMGWTGMVMLGVNYLSASANLIQGKVFNFIEGMGGQWYNGKNVLNADIKFFMDMASSDGSGGWMNDSLSARSVKTSKTNQLMNLVNLQGEFKGLAKRFNENNKVKELMKRNTLFFMNHSAEFYIHGTLMYAIMDNIKVKNSKGQFVDKDGNVVSKAKAMTFDEAFTVDKETNKLVLNKHASNISFGQEIVSFDLDSDKGILEVRNLINKIAYDIQGNYNDEVQSLAQRHIWGKMAFMLRKWIVPAFNRRWRGGNKATKRKSELREIDRFYSEDLQSFQEGYYTTFIRFITTVAKDLKRLGISAAYKQAKGQLTSHEEANLRRTTYELGMIALSFLSSILLLKSLDGLDDDDDEGLLYLAFTTRRLYSELAFFIDPASTLQILYSPSATISYSADIVKAINQLASDGTSLLVGDGLELYERGKHKGMPKLWVRFTDLLPVAKNVDRTIYESTSYIYNTRAK